MFFIISVILITQNKNDFGCSCDWGGNFLKVESYSDLTIVGKVVKQNYYNEETKELTNFNYSDQLHRKSIVVEVIKVLKGKETREEIEIFGSEGVDCFESVTIFNPGSYYVFSIYKYSESFKSEFGGVIFKLWGCSEHWLKYDVVTNEVNGWIKGKKRLKKRSMSISKLTEKIKQ